MTAAAAKTACQGSSKGAASSIAAAAHHPSGTHSIHTNFTKQIFADRLIFHTQLESSSAVWFPSDGERQVAQRLASAAAAGLQLTQSVQGHGHMSWQIIRGAAVMPTVRRNGSPRAPDGSSSPRASAAASEV